VSVPADTVFRTKPVAGARAVSVQSLNRPARHVRRRRDEGPGRRRERRHGCAAPHRTVEDRSMVKTIVGSFDSFNEAHQVANELRAAGFLDSDISIVANNADGAYANDARLDDTTTARTVRDDDTSATAKGAVAGAVVGGGAGLAASLAGLAIPGIGPIIAAGPIVATLAGAGTGAVAGGLIGGLVDVGVPETDAEYYAEAVRRGGALVTVRADESRAEEAADIMRDRGAVDIQRRVERWREQGWERFDAGAQPYTADDIRRDRGMY
jgi:hypothetical protein